MSDRLTCEEFRKMWKEGLIDQIPLLLLFDVDIHVDSCQKCQKWIIQEK